MDRFAINGTDHFAKRYIWTVLQKKTCLAFLIKAFAAYNRLKQFSNVLIGRYERTMHVLRRRCGNFFLTATVLGRSYRHLARNWNVHMSTVGRTHWYSAKYKLYKGFQLLFQTNAT